MDTNEEKPIMHVTDGSDQPSPAITARVDALGSRHPPGSGTPQEVREHVADPSWLSTSTWTAMGQGAPGRQRLRQHQAALDPAILARHAAAFARQSPSLRTYLASQELTTAIRVERDGLTVRLGGGTTTLRPPPTGAALTQLVMDTAAALQAEGEQRRGEIEAQALRLELLFAIAIGTAVDPSHPDAAPRTLELIDAISWASSWPIYRSKHLLNVPRPDEVEASLRNRTILPTPPHASYPSGHAAVSHALAEVLSALMGDAPGGAVHGFLHDFAARIARNREFAGLHTADDSSTGRALGTALGRWMVQAASADQTDLPLWALLYAEACQEWMASTSAGAAA